jgi:hypothetical protein
MMRFDFRREVHSNARLSAIVNMLESQLHSGEVTAHDLARCAVLAAQLYAERNCAPIVLRLDDGTLERTEAEPMTVIAHTQASPTIREEVAAFATHMESKLRGNDHKGGWENDDLGSLVSRAVEELQELQRAISAFEHVRYSPKATAEALKDAAKLVLREAADVANFAMMIADNADRIAR